MTRTSLPRLSLTGIIVINRYQVLAAKKWDTSDPTSTELDEMPHEWDWGYVDDIALMKVRMHV